MTDFNAHDISAGVHYQREQHLMQGTGVMKPSRVFGHAPRFATLAVAALLSANAVAGDRYVGDWHWNIDDPEMLYAGIETLGNHMLAQYCLPESGSCVYAVGFDIHCETGDEYPVLVNSDVGAMHMEFVCGDRVDDQNLLVAKDFEQMDDLIRSASQVGFAIPMQGDEFKAVRFSLRGSNEAIDAMRSAAERAQSRSPGQRPKPAVERF